ncbi:hypothetical protein [Haloarchaeobius sp. DFWS5]|uniref:hypothetical protein n=1 Tax=Haloarchaeobius sp. DFWS5 TaxID=3446114 RepID=UPI003EB74221
MVSQWVVLAGVAATTAGALFVSTTSDDQWQQSVEGPLQVVTRVVFGTVVLTLLVAGVVSFAQLIAGTETLTGRTVPSFFDELVAVLCVIVGAYLVVARGGRFVDKNESPMSTRAQTTIWTITGASAGVAALVTYFL